MLSIGKLARGQENYYLEQANGRVDHATSVESGVEDYYLGGPEAKGDWLGAIALELDLPRRVSDDGLRLALAGGHPSTGAGLTTGGAQSGARVCPAVFAPQKRGGGFGG